MDLKAYALVALGGAIGAMLRFATTHLVGVAGLFPWATFGINIAGALAIGLVWGIWQEADWFIAWGRLLLVVGLLGGFTTFSAFSIEALMLLQQDRLLLAVAYVGSSVLVCIGLAWLGFKLGQQLV